MTDVATIPDTTLVNAAGLFNIAASEYHADPCEQPSLSSSIARILINQSPAHALIAHPRLNHDYESSDEAKFDLGTVAHGVLLEGDGSVEIIDAADWRTNAAKDAAVVARAKGRTPLLAKDWARVEAMTTSARKQLEYVDADPPLFTDGRPEQTLVWQEDGVTCRCLIDWLRDDRATVDDYKTTAASAEPGAWTRTMLNIGADVQVAFYLRGLEALGFYPEWRYVVQENYAPYALSVVTIGPAMLARAAEKVDAAIEKWRECITSGNWPAYTRSVTELQLPAWAT